MGSREVPQKIRPDLFSFFDVCWIQTHNQTDKWLFSIVISLEKWLAHFYYRKPYKIIMIDQIKVARVYPCASKLLKSRFSIIKLFEHTYIRVLLQETLFSLSITSVLTLPAAIIPPTTMLRASPPHHTSTLVSLNRVSVRCVYESCMQGLH